MLKKKKTFKMTAAEANFSDRGAKPGHWLQVVRYSKCNALMWAAKSFPTIVCFLFCFSFKYQSCEKKMRGRNFCCYQSNPFAMGLHCIDLFEFDADGWNWSIKLDSWLATGRITRKIDKRLMVDQQVISWPSGKIKERRGQCWVLNPGTLFLFWTGTEA